MIHGVTQKSRHSLSPVLVGAPKIGKHPRFSMITEARQGGTDIRRGTLSIPNVYVQNTDIASSTSSSMAYMGAWVIGKGDYRALILGLLGTGLNYLCFRELLTLHSGTGEQSRY